MTASQGASIRKSRDVRIAISGPTWTHDALAEVLERDVQHHLLRPLDHEMRERRDQIEDQVEANPRPVLTHGCQVVLAVLTALLERLRRIPHHPVIPPVV